MGDRELHARLLETKYSLTPLADFCRISTEAGVPLYEMDLLSAGEDYYASMRRYTNGGENSPMLVGKDDYYELFIEELESATVRQLL